MGSDGHDLTELSDAALLELAATVAGEQTRRALERADVGALIEWGFEHMFNSSGMPEDPEVRSGIIVCGGAKNDRSASSHDCGFVSLRDGWVWESESHIADVVRYLPGPRTKMRSVSLVVPGEGLELDLVVSKLKSGEHQMRSVRSFVVRGGELEMVSARARKVEGHR